MKLSFIVPAHNEEKIIEKTLKNLQSVPYNKYEVLIGLDGCTDSTEEIVKRFIGSGNSKRFKYFNLNSRKGKPDVVDFLIGKSSGDIIIINDADWIFSIKRKSDLDEFLSIFKSKKIGGIAESYPVEWSEPNLEESNFWYKMVAFSHYYWFKFQKKNFTERLNRNLLKINTSIMFLTNVFRKDLYKRNTSLGDDFERTKFILDKGYDVVLFDNEDFPRMISTYKKIRLGDFLKQKIRTAIARRQLDSSKQMEVPKNYYFKSISFIFINGWKEGRGIYVSAWIFLMVLSTIISKLKKTNTKKGWTLRAKRT